MTGRYVALRPFDAQQHAEPLWHALGDIAANTLLWHFGWPQMDSADDLARILVKENAAGDYVTFVFTPIDDAHNACGMASYMRISQEHGRIETGAIAHGQGMRHTRAATEAHYLMASYVFDTLGYRRYEWKLNNTNAPSHAAARRLGFTFEGIFRQHEVKPYGSRDTAWYAMLDHEWPRCKAALEAWLDPENFDTSGGQKSLLTTLRAQHKTR